MCRPNENTEEPLLLLQGDPIQWTTRYKYLGVTLAFEPRYCVAYEEELRAKATA